MKALKFETIQSILVICPNWVGDFVMATPTFCSLRAIFPKRRISLLVKPSLADLAQGASWCDESFIYDRRGVHKGFWGWMRLWKTLQSQNFDLVLVLPNSLRSGIVGKLSGAKYRVGYDRPAGILCLSHRKKRRKERTKFRPMYMGYYYGDLLEAFFPGKVQQVLDLPLLSEQNRFAKEYWKKIGPSRSSMKIAIAPGASFGSSKLWPTSHFAKLIDLLGENYSPKILLVPGPGEEEIAGEIDSLSHYPISILPPIQGKLGVLKSFLAQADLLICNDSGARHISHAFGVPTVVLMGPTDPRHSENPNAPHQVLRNIIPCVPCHQKRCPLGHHACMTGIDPHHAFRASQNFLAPIVGEKSLLETT